MFDAIQSFDISVLNAIQDNLRCTFLDYTAIFLSYLTTSGIICIVTGIVLLFFKKTRAAGIILIIALGLTFLTGDVLLKHLINRPRPFITYPDVELLVKKPSGASFPSTHSGLAAATATVLLAKKRVLGYIALGLAICIALSRLYLFVHYPSDVICGLLLGVLCGIAALMIAKATKLETRLSKHN